MAGSVSGYFLTRTCHGRLMRTRALFIPALVSGLILAACGGDEPRVLTGAFTLQADNIAGSWDSCRGEGGYSDFGRGMNVTVRSGSGEVIGTGNTRNLTDADLGDLDLSENGEDDISMLELTAAVAQIRGTSRCTVWFEAEIGEADFYSIEIGRRGELTYSASELADRDWHVELSLGD